MTGFEGEELAAPVGEPTAPRAPRLRVVRLERFEAAVPLADEEREAYRRRFCMLFVDDDRARRGGLGNVAYAQNALGERLALKTVLGLGHFALHLLFVMAFSLATGLVVNLLV